MKNLIDPFFSGKWRLAVGLCVAAWLLAACGRQEPPQPLPLSEIPSAMTVAFTNASPQIKSLADQAVEAIQTENYLRAYNQFQALVSIPELEKDQRSIASRAMLTANNELAAAAESEGDQEAIQALQFHQATK